LDAHGFNKADAPTAFLRPSCDGGGQPLFLIDGIARTHVPRKFEDSAYKEYLVWRQRDGSMLMTFRLRNEGG